MTSRTWVLATACLALGGCKAERPAPPLARPATPAPAPVKVVKTGSSTSSVPGQSDPNCLGPIDLAAPQQLTLGGRKAELAGYKLTFAAPANKDAPVSFGVLGGINEDSGENLVNLAKYVEFFKAEKVDAILVGGDVGESAEAIARGLAPLAETGLPTFALIGNRECSGDFNDAIARLQKTSPNLVNFNKVRHVEFGTVDLLSLPGYHDKRYLHCASGCQYFKQDVEALKALAQAAKNPVVLVAHGPPRGATQAAVDSAAEAGNVGDTNLNALITEAGIPFGVFPNIKEAGARATDLEGASVLKEGQLASRLYLNPGPADSVAWAMNDGTQSVGMAAVLTVQGRQASYKLFRARPLTAEEKAQAARLAPAPKAELAKKPEPAPK